MKMCLCHILILHLVNHLCEHFRTLNSADSCSSPTQNISELKTCWQRQQNHFMTREKLQLLEKIDVCHNSGVPAGFVRNFDPKQIGSTDSDRTICSSVWNKDCFSPNLCRLRFLFLLTEIQPDVVFCDFSQVWSHVRAERLCFPLLLKKKSNLIPVSLNLFHHSSPELISSNMNPDQKERTGVSINCFQKPSRYMDYK